MAVSLAYQNFNHDVLVMFMLSQYRINKITFYFWFTFKICWWCVLYDPKTKTEIGEINFVILEI